MTTFNQANFCSHFFEYGTFFLGFNSSLNFWTHLRLSGSATTNSQLLHVENEERIKKLFDFDWLFSRVREIDSYIVRT